MISKTYLVDFYGKLVSKYTIVPDFHTNPNFQVSWWSNKRSTAARSVNGKPTECESSNWLAVKWTTGKLRGEIVRVVVAAGLLGGPIG